MIRVGNSMRLKWANPFTPNELSNLYQCSELISYIRVIGLHYFSYSIFALLFCKQTVNSALYMGNYICSMYNINSSKTSFFYFLLAFVCFRRHILSWVNVQNFATKTMLLVFKGDGFF